MSDRSRSVEEYLARLGEALDVLGSEQAAEIVAEIEGHISDAIAERGGGVEEVLSEFGAPEVLATRILEERGILSGAPFVGEAPRGVRLLAMVIDIAVWLLVVSAVNAALQIALTVKVITDRHMLAAIGFYAVQAVVLSLSFFWWAWARGVPGRSTIGMRLIGLRRARIAQKVITVRLADIPGAPRPSRLLPALIAGFALLAIVPALSSVYGDLKVGQQDDEAFAVSDVSTAASAVGELYRRVENGVSLNDVSSDLAPSARPGVSALIGRRSAGQLDNYVVERLEVVRYSPDLAVPIPGFAPPAGAVVSEIVVRAHVSEYAKNSAEGRPYVVQVRERMTSDGGSGGAFSMGYGANGKALVESIAREDQ